MGELALEVEEQFEGDGQTERSPARPAGLVLGGQGGPLSKMKRLRSSKPPSVSRARWSMTPPSISAHA
ncbi:hypothetical protein F9278_04225 [Streptomyces phaeolivaceus]|uniref:Uncharacterized protein n=1 Tax=Streptomyces phaeolivaceus TaxID=2653200 RepID=A0A5P8JWW9_9ACTN|nr:hypothetical protein [Streptomyces phaeolivaceus]QFQ95523.1 hypothetical protein F9278_04225 [Streptomyces phaeolivaceus]